MIDYPAHLDLAQLPTPLQCLTRLSEELGGPRIWVKRDDMTGAATSGNKVRKLEFTLARLLEQDCDTLITCGGNQSNHCRTAAVLGTQLGLKVHLLLRCDSAPEPNGNLFLDQLVGAEITLMSQKDYWAAGSKLFDPWVEHYRNQGRKPYVITTGASDATGAWGYIRCCEELKRDFASHHINPELIVHATGSGGTQAGLSAGVTLFGLDAKVVGMAVCDSEQYFLDKVTEDLTGWKALYDSPVEIDSIDLQVNDHYIGPGYAKAGREVFDTIEKLAKLEGLLLDPVYTGKAFHGLIEEINNGDWKNHRDIVFVHTGGIFGLMAQGDKFYNNPR